MTRDCYDKILFLPLRANMMTNRIKFILLFVFAIILQAALLPSHFSDPFKPNLLIMFVVYMGFRESIRLGGIGSLLTGLVQDSLSGVYFGLSGFSFLVIFIAFKAVSHRFYTDSRSLMVIGVFFASIFNALIQLLLLTLFSVGDGIFSSILTATMPQAVVNAVVAAIAFRFAVRREKTA